mgnify:CR=1 FL=1
MSEKAKANDRAKRIVPGLSDEDFERGDVPLTKEEIRCLTLSKLKLEEGNRVLDIGAGSGGLTVECALLLGGEGVDVEEDKESKNDRYIKGCSVKDRVIKSGEVMAVERDPEAAALVRVNLERFNLQNVTVIEGKAPAVLQGLGSFNRVLIGGSGGSLAEIIDRVYELLVPGGVVVLNCILLQTLAESLDALEKSGFSEISFIQAAISRSRKMGSGTALQPLNPVFIVSAVKGVN